MPQYGNPYGGVPSQNTWIGNNYSSGYSNPMNRPAYQIPMNNAMQSTGMSPFSNMNPPAQPMNNIIQVMSPESAQAFQTGPNSHIAMFHVNKPIFYMKHSDDSGYSETKAYQYFEIPLNETEPQLQQMQQVQKTQSNSVEYVTKEKFDEVINLLGTLVTKDELAEFKTTIEDLVTNDDKSKNIRIHK